MQGHPQGSVTQHCTDAGKADAMPEHCRCCRVAQAVGALMAAFALGGREEALDVLLTEEVRRRLQLPSGQAGHGVFAPRRALSGRRQLTQKGARCRRNQLRVRMTMRSGTFEHKIPYCLSVVGLRVSSKRLKKNDNGMLIDVQRGLCDAAMRTHPVSKHAENRPDLRRRRRLWAKRNHSLSLKIIDEQRSSPEPYFGRPLALEDLRGCVVSGVYRINGEPGRVNPIGPMPKQSHEPVDGSYVISLPFEPVPETLDLREREVQSRVCNCSLFLSNFFRHEISCICNLTATPAPGRPLLRRISFERSSESRRRSRDYAECSTAKTAGVRAFALRDSA